MESLESEIKDVAAKGIATTITGGDVRDMTNAAALLPPELAAWFIEAVKYLKPFLAQAGVTPVPSEVGYDPQGQSASNDPYLDAGPEASSRPARGRSPASKGTDDARRSRSGGRRRLRTKSAAPACYSKVLTSQMGGSAGEGTTA